MLDKHRHRRTQTDSSPLREIRPLTLRLLFTCVCLLSLLSSLGAAGYCQPLKCPLSCSLPRAAGVQRSRRVAEWWPAVLLWALLATCLDIRKITSPLLILTGEPGGDTFLAPMPDCLSVHTSASPRNKMCTSNSTRYRQTLHNVSRLCSAEWLVGFDEEKAHLSGVLCPAVAALFSITTSNLMQNHFPGVREPCSYIDKSFFQSFQFAWGRWIVGVTQSAAAIQFRKLSALDLRR